MEGLAVWYPDVMANLMTVAGLPTSPRHLKLYGRLKGDFPTMIPAGVNSEDDLDRLTWWGMAAKGANDQTTLKGIKTRLNGFDTQVEKFYNVALLGHICHLLSNNPATRFTR